MAFKKTHIPGRTPGFEAGSAGGGAAGHADGFVAAPAGGGAAGHAPGSVAGDGPGCAGGQADRRTAADRFRAAYWQALRDLDALRLSQWEQSQLTLPQLRVLFHVRRTPGVTTGQLARSLEITMSTTSGLVSKLVDRGLVVRGISEEDRRQIPLELTESGRELAGELCELTRPFTDGVAEQLGDDLAPVVTALENLAAATARVRGR